VKARRMARLLCQGNVVPDVAFVRAVAMPRRAAADAMMAATPPQTQAGVRTRTEPLDSQPLKRGLRILA